MTSVSTKIYQHYTSKCTMFKRKTYITYNKDNYYKLSNYLSDKTSTQICRSKVKNIDLTSVKPQRAGVVLYTFIENNLYLGFGIDNKSKEITDFGGHVYYKQNKDGNVINGALREFHEETLNIFSEFHSSVINECEVLYDESNLIIFLHIDINPHKISSCFNDKFNFVSIMNNINKNNQLSSKNIAEPEVSSIIWLDSYEFYNKLNSSGFFFSRVRNFLSKAGDFLNHL